MKGIKEKTLKWLLQYKYFISLWLLGGIFLFVSLDDRYLWTDEASTAIFARSIIREGIPKVWDGKNLLIHWDGPIFNEEFIGTEQPWFSYYLTALSFLVLDESTFSARLPFAIIGFITLILIQFWIKKENIHKNLPIIVTILAVMSPSFLLYSRQCRYYSLCMLFPVLMLVTYRNLASKSVKSILSFVVVSILFFHTNYLVFFCFSGALIICFFLLEFDVQKLKSLIIAFILVGFFTIPWLLFSKSWVFLGEHDSMGFFKNFLKLIISFFRQYDKFGWFPVLLILWIPLGIYIKHRFSDIKKIVFYALFCILYTILITFFIAISVDIPPFAEMRHAVTLLPIMLLLVGWIISEIFSYKSWLGNTILFIVIFTNLFSVNYFYSTRQRIKSAIFDYLYELAHPVKDPYKEIATFLNYNAKREDLAMVWPFHSVIPLMFYTNLRFCAIINTERPLSYTKNINQLPDYLYSENVIPEWIIAIDGEPDSALKIHILKQLNELKIKYDVLRLNLTYLGDTARPELPEHQFRTFIGRKKIKIYERIK
ncbi:MAG: hypothetical protein JW983_07255 [Elusimicrobia bacterium]|nr:hypothetical protein [Elusimicrobiota bacterium]